MSLRNKQEITMDHKLYNISYFKYGEIATNYQVTFYFSR